MLAVGQLLNRTETGMVCRRRGGRGGRGESKIIEQVIRYEDKFIQVPIKFTFLLETTLLEAWNSIFPIAHGSSQQ